MVDVLARLLNLIEHILENLSHAGIDDLVNGLIRDFVVLGACRLVATYEFCLLGLCERDEFCCEVACYVVASKRQHCEHLGLVVVVD